MDTVRRYGGRFVTVEGGEKFELTFGDSELHTKDFLSGPGDVTLTLRASSGEGGAGWKGDCRGEDGEGGSRLRLWVESLLLWPFGVCGLR